MTASSLYAGMSKDTSGQPPSGSSALVGSSRQRKTSPPATHSAAVQIGYSATNSSRPSATDISPLLAAARGQQRVEDEHRDQARPHRHRNPDSDRPGVLEHECVHDERDEPQDGPDDQRHD